jgi:hypothetical protein
MASDFVRCFCGSYLGVLTNYLAFFSSFPSLAFANMALGLGWGVEKKEKDFYSLWWAAVAFFFYLPFSTVLHFYTMNFSSHHETCSRICVHS